MSLLLSTSGFDDPSLSSDSSSKSIPAKEDTVAVDVDSIMRGDKVEEEKAWRFIGPFQ